MMSSSSANRELRVGLLIASLEFGGAQKSLLSIALGLLKKGYTVRLILIDDIRVIDLPGDATERRALKQSIRVLREGRPWRRRFGTIGKVLGMALSLRRLRAVVEQENLSVVVSFLERANILNLMALEGTPRIISIRKHMEMALAEKSWLKATLVRLAYPLLLRRAAAIVCNADESAQSFVKVFPQTKSPVFAIVNSVNIEAVGAAAASAGAAEELGSRPFVVAMGRMKPAKGFVPLIRAFSRVHLEAPDTMLLLIGDGPDRPKLEQLVKHFGLVGSVRIEGYKPNPYPWMKGATVFVLSSRAEGFPNALLEAMALGIPVVAADCPSGPREMLAPTTVAYNKTKTLERAQYGVIVPPMPKQDLPSHVPLLPSEIALADGILELLRDASLREKISVAVQRRALQLSPDAMIDQWDGLIHGVVAGRAVIETEKP